MIYLLDTNIVSESIKKVPNPKAIDWLASVDIKKCSLSVITLGEIRKGVEKLIDSQKKHKIVQWLEQDLLMKFEGRILSITPAIADKWGFLIAQNPNIPAIDALIAATALTVNAKLVTRNTKDFVSVSGLELINPWGDI